MTDALRQSGLVADADAARFPRAGHFACESGLHGDTALALGLLVAAPRRLHQAAARLADKLRPHTPDLVCGPLVGGALVGQWVAFELGVPFVYAEPQPATTATARRYAVPPELGPTLRGKRAAIVDDVINAGAATHACAREIETWGGTVVAVGSLIARTPGPVDRWPDHGLPVAHLLGLPWHTWPAADCPLCRARVPVDPLSPTSA